MKDKNQYCYTQCQVGCNKQTKHKSVKQLTTLRDNFLVDLIKLKNKYKI